MPTLGASWRVWASPVAWAAVGTNRKPFTVSRGAVFESINGNCPVAGALSCGPEAAILCAADAGPRESGLLDVGHGEGPGGLLI